MHAFLLREREERRKKILGKRDHEMCSMNEQWEREEKNESVHENCLTFCVYEEKDTNK